ASGVPASGVPASGVPASGVPPSGDGGVLETPERTKSSKSIPANVAAIPAAPAAVRAALLVSVALSFGTPSTVASSVTRTVPCAEKLNEWKTEDPNIPQQQLSKMANPSDV